MLETLLQQKNYEIFYKYSSTPDIRGKFKTLPFYLPTYGERAYPHEFNK